MPSDHVHSAGSRRVICSQVPPIHAAQLSSTSADAAAHFSSVLRIASRLFSFSQCVFAAAQLEFAFLAKVSEKPLGGGDGDGGGGDGDGGGGDGGGGDGAGGGGDGAGGGGDAAPPLAGAAEKSARALARLKAAAQTAVLASRIGSEVESSTKSLDRPDAMSDVLQSNADVYAGASAEAVLCLRADFPLRLAVLRLVLRREFELVVLLLIAAFALRSPRAILDDVNSTWLPGMQVSLRFWPVVHTVTFSALIPSELKLLWVDACEIIWIAILSQVNNDEEPKSLSLIHI